MANFARTYTVTDSAGVQTAKQAILWLDDDLDNLITDHNTKFGATITGVVDEDDMASDSAAKFASQQSIKAYVDNNKNKNALINGGMDIAQRGTSFTSTTTPANSDDTFLLDRWLLLSDGNDIVDVTQQSAGGVSGNENYIRLDVETAAKKFGICQVIENKNCKGMIGGTVSLSFEAKVTNATKLSDIRAAVFAWASTADTVTSDLVATWEAEDTIITPAANWTAENVAANLGVTTSWVKYTISGISIDTASAANIAVFIYQNNVATNDTAGIFLEITNVQLEASTKATKYEYRQFGDELAKCRRYYQLSYSYGTYPGAVTSNGAKTGSVLYANTVGSGDRFVVDMRAAPTVTIWNPDGTSGEVVRMTDNVDIAATAASIGTTGFANIASAGLGTIPNAFTYNWEASAEL